MSTLLIAVILFAHVASEALEARGAAKRRRPMDAPAVDIEDVIRAEYDPNFAEYIKQREREKQIQEEGQRKHLQEVLANKEARVKEELQYLMTHKVEDTSELEDQQELAFQAKQKALREAQEKGLQEYEQRMQVEAIKREAEKMARLQKAFSSDRMPASVQK